MPPTLSPRFDIYPTIELLDALDAWRDRHAPSMKHRAAVARLLLWRMLEADKGAPEPKDNPNA